MILLWGLPGDDPLDAVVAALTAAGARYLLLDQRRALEHRIERDLAPGDGIVRCGHQRIALAEVGAVYTRVYDARQLPKVAAADADARRTLAEVETALWSWADHADARVVNRPSAMASNGSKPYQAAIIAAAGFAVPETLVTTDPEAAAGFWDRHGEVVYKSVSGVRSRVSRLRAEHRDRLADVTGCPTQFQRWIAGRDHRVHVVGERAFAAEVVSDADDYRYAASDGRTCTLRAAQLPDEVIARCHGAARALGLPVAGLDLRLATDGRWYCFEVNPSPCFTYYEHHTGQPIAAALADYLAAAPCA